MSFIDIIDFKLTALTFKIRDILHPPKKALLELGIAEGQSILDYGCGPGGYSYAAAKLVGKQGKVYAADNNENVYKHIKKKSYSNLFPILTDCSLDLPDKSIDIILLLDTYHCLEQPKAVLAELHRVLKNGGALSFSDHHMEEDNIISKITKDNLFKLSSKGKHTYNFVKIG